MRKSRLLTLKEVEEELPEKLDRAGIESILNCLQCGVCTASCPSGRVTAFNIRQLIRRASLGMKEILLSPNLWMCTTCFTCVERCPKKIDIVPVVIALRNQAVEHGYILSRHREVSHMFIRTGHLVPINDENRKKRETLGLEEVPPTVYASNLSLIELRSLLKKSGFEKKVGFQ